MQAIHTLLVAPLFQSIENLLLSSSFKDADTVVLKCFVAEESFTSQSCCTDFYQLPCNSVERTKGQILLRPDRWSEIAYSFDFSCIDPTIYSGNCGNSILGIGTRLLNSLIFSLDF